MDSCPRSRRQDERAVIPDASVRVLPGVPGAEVTERFGQLPPLFREFEGLVVGRSALTSRARFGCDSAPRVFRELRPFSTGETRYSRDDTPARGSASPCAPRLGFDRSGNRRARASGAGELVGHVSMDQLQPRRSWLSAARPGSGVGAERVRYSIHPAESRDLQLPCQGPASIFTRGSGCRVETTRHVQCSQPSAWMHLRLWG